MLHSRLDYPNHLDIEFRFAKCCAQGSIAPTTRISISFREVLHSRLDHSNHLDIEFILRNVALKPDHPITRHHVRFAKLSFG